MGLKMNQFLLAMEDEIVRGSTVAKLNNAWLMGPVLRLERASVIGRITCVCSDIDLVQNIKRLGDGPNAQMLQISQVWGLLEQGSTCRHINANIRYFSAAA